MGRLSNVQVVRAIAALLVVLSHALHETDAMTAHYGLPPLMPATHRWTAAVDVFFVMSGFILLSISLDKFGEPRATREFFIRRLVRAVPLYWLLTTLVLVTGLVLPGMLNVQISDVRQVVASYLFWPYPRGAGELRPVLALGWTMNLEFFFYALLALALAFPRRAGIALLSLIMAGTVVLQQVFHFETHYMVFYGSTLTLDFILGLVIAILYRARIKLPAAVCAVAMVSAVAFILLAKNPDPAEPSWFFAISLPAACFFAATVFAPQMPDRTRLQKSIILIGDACYSIYLLQPFLFRPAAKIWMSVIGDRLSIWIFVVVVSAFAIAAGTLCFRMFESPLTAWLNARLRSWEMGRIPKSDMDFRQAYPSGKPPIAK